MYDLVLDNLIPSEVDRTQFKPPSENKDCIQGTFGTFSIIGPDKCDPLSTDEDTKTT